MPAVRCRAWPQQFVNHRVLALPLHQNNGARDEGPAENRATAISAAWAKRQHDALRDKIEDKMVADLEAIVANIKRAR